MNEWMPYRPGDESTHPQPGRYDVRCMTPHGFSVYTTMQWTGTPHCVQTWGEKWVAIYRKPQTGFVDPAESNRSEQQALEESRR